MAIFIDPTPVPDTWLAGQVVTLDMLNANVRDMQRFLGYAPLTILTRSTTQSIANATSTAVSWDTEISDGDDMITVPGTDIIAQRPGLYVIQFVTNFATNSGGDQRAASIRVNGNSVGQEVDFRSVSVGTLNNCSALVALNTGDVINGMVYQDSGGALNIGGGFNAPRIAVRLASTANVDVDYGAGTTSNPKPPSSKPPTANSPTSHTNTYHAQWSRTYNGDGTTTWDDSGFCYQGYYSSDRGNTRSLVGFDYTQIQSDLAGATNIHVKVTFKVAHSFYFSGMNVVAGTHTYAAKPGTWSTASVHENLVQRGSAAPGGTYTLDFGKGSDSSKSFKSWAKGIAFGPGPSRANAYYGYLYGSGMGGHPYLTISFTK